VHISKCTTKSTIKSQQESVCSRNTSKKQEILVAWTQRWGSGDLNKEHIGGIGIFVDEEEEK